MNIDLTPHIFAILFQHETVIFPGFGGLVTSYKPASIDYVQGIIFPPSTSTSFNERMNTSDGLLEKFVRSQFNLPTEEATQAIVDYVENLNALLDKGEIVLLPKVGRLYRNYERKLQFLPENTNFNKASYGLPPVHFYPILRANEGTPVGEAPKPVEQPKMVGKSRPLSKWMQMALPVLIGCGLLSITISLYFLQPVQPGLADSEPKKVPVVETRLNLKPETEHAGIGHLEDIEPARTSADPHSSTQEAFDTGEEPIETKEPTETESPSLLPSARECIIILGAFRQKSGVQATIEEVYDLGYDAYQDKKNGLTRVGVQFAYDKESDIHRTLRHLRKKINKKAWIYRK